MESSLWRQLIVLLRGLQFPPFNRWMFLREEEEKGGGARNNNSISSANIRVHPQGCHSSNCVCVVLNMESEITVHASPLNYLWSLTQKWQDWTHACPLGVAGNVSAWSQPEPLTGSCSTRWMVKAGPTWAMDKARLPLLVFAAPSTTLFLTTRGTVSLWGHSNPQIPPSSLETKQANYQQRDIRGRGDLSSH